MREFCHRQQIRPYRPPYRYLRGDPDRQGATKAELEDDEKKAQAGECVLLSQDEARFPLVPTLRATLGVKGHRPVVGTWDNKDLVYSFAALNVVTGQLTTRLVESPAGRSAHGALQDGAVAARVCDSPARPRPSVPGSLGKPISSQSITPRGIRPQRCRGARRPSASPVVSSSQLQPSAQSHRAVLAGATARSDS